MSTDQPAGRPAVTPAIEPWLREILRCPYCGGVLRDGTADGTPAGPPELACTACPRAYRVDDGIPVLLVDEARLRTDA